MSAAELLVDPVGFDERRPWPLGLPTQGRVLEAIGGQSEVDELMKSAHLRVLSMLPENLHEAARTSLAGTDNPLALATASAWRALLAADRISHAIAVDQPALHTLIHEAVDAREKILAAGYFALDGGAGAEELLSALGSAIEQLVEQAEFRARVRPVNSQPQTRVSIDEADKAPQVVWGKALRWTFTTTMLITLLVQLSGVLTDGTPTAWVVVGDVDHGHAYVASGGAEADEASLREFISQLETRGIYANQSPAGEWVLSRQVPR